MQLPQDSTHRAILDSVFRAPAYRWVEARDPLAFVRHAWLAFKEWFRELQDRNPVGYQVVLYALLAILALVLLHALWVFYRTVGRELPQDESGAETTGAPRTVARFQREAERLALEGRYAEAIQADFLALVLTLDARKLVHFHPSKTPAEYLRESQLTPAASAEFRDLVRSVYGYAFARWPCGPAEYAQWRLNADPERYAATH